MSETFDKSRRRVTLLVFAGLLLTIVVGVSSYRIVSQAILADAETELQLLLNLRKSALLKQLETMRAELLFWSRSDRLHKDLKAFSTAWKKLGGRASSTLQKLYIAQNPYPAKNRKNLLKAKDRSRYSAVHSRYHPVAKSFLEQRGYYDVFLFDQDGNLVYTILKQSDFATNFITGPWRDSSLATAFRKARDAEERDYVVMTDFMAYEPSKGAPASFIATSVYDGRNKFLGVLALQVPAEPINKTMRFTGGMGDTGETYIVSKDLFMRSDSRFKPESSILKTKVDTVAVRKALDGGHGIQITSDYRGVSVLSAYAPLNFSDVTWAAMAVKDESEVMMKVNRICLIYLIVGGIVMAIIISTGALFVFVIEHNR